MPEAIGSRLAQAGELPEWPIRIQRSKSARKKTAQSPSQKLKVGLVLINLQAKFFNDINAGASDEAKKAGVAHRRSLADHTDPLSIRWTTPVDRHRPRCVVSPQGVDP